MEPNEADAGAIMAYGRGLYEATAGEAATFMLQARDAYGNNRLTEQVSKSALRIVGTRYVLGDRSPLRMLRYFRIERAVCQTRRDL